MKGSIRMVVGLLIVFGAVGGLDVPENNELLCAGLAIAGLLIMASGINAMKKVV